MIVKTYNGLLPKIRFYNIEENIYYEYNNQKNILSLEGLNNLENVLELPYKLSFYNIPLEQVNDLLKIFKKDDAKLFFYRENDLKSNNIIIHAIFLENIKVKKR